MFADQNPNAIFCFWLLMSVYLVCRCIHQDYKKNQEAINRPDYERIQQLESELEASGLLERRVDE